MTSGWTAEGGPPDGEGAAAEFDAGLGADGVTFDGRDAALLRAVGAAGSVSGAARDLERSRARALSRLETLEGAFGDLVERHRGGADGGGSRLTPAAGDLLARFDRLRAALAGTAGAAESVFAGELAERDGELAVVSTGAGTVRAVVVGDLSVGDTAEVSVRADAVTLHAPEETPSPDATSARNRLSGTVTAVDRGTAVVDVRLDVGAGDDLAALVTTDSADRLALDPGAAVVASFKATATRASARDE